MEQVGDAGQLGGVTPQSENTHWTVDAIRVISDE